jgi:hypothetical protein
MYTRMNSETHPNKLIQYLNDYKVHYIIGAFVYLSFAISGFQFDIIQSSTLTRLIYGFLQVFLLILNLSLAKELFVRVFPEEKSVIKLNLFAILLGTFTSFLLDYLLIAAFELIDSNCTFKALTVIEPNFAAYLQYYSVGFLEELKYPTLFWPLCELADSYFQKLTQAIKNETNIEKSSFEELPFFKDVPRSQRKNLLAIEAQQNYIQLIFPENTYTVLYRLKDAISLIPKDLGMKVHRSYRVSFLAIDKLKNSTTIILSNGKEVPVSRSFSNELKSKL